MKCPHCGEELGLNNICINPMCSYFSTKIDSTESSNSTSNLNTTVSHNDDFSNSYSGSHDQNNFNNTDFNTNNNDYKNYSNNTQNNNSTNGNFNYNTISKDEFIAFLGPKNPSYYLKYMDKYNSDKKFTSWNWPSFFLGIYWLLYRKLYLVAVIYFALNCAIKFIFDTSSVSLLFRIMFAVFANCIYIRSAENKIKKVKASKSSLSYNQYFRELQQKGGTTFIVPIVVCILLFVIIFILFAAFEFTSVPEIPAHYYHF